jgi:hypothetical protein
MTGEIVIFKACSMGLQHTAKSTKRIPPATTLLLRPKVRFHWDPVEMFKPATTFSLYTLARW